MSKKIMLCTAQTFGYGPYSALFYVARLVRNDFEIKLALGKDEKIFHQLNPAIFSEIIPMNNGYDFNMVIGKAKPNIILSALEPNILLAARKHKIQSYFIDPLFWFWEIKQELALLDQVTREAVEQGLSDIYDLSHEVTPHERIFLGHFLSDTSYVQCDAFFKDRLNIVKQYTQIKIVGAMILNSEAVQADRNHILITMNGGVIPFIDTESTANYTELVLDLVYSLSELYFTDCQWTVLVNPSLLEVVHGRGKVRNNAQVVVRNSADQEGMNNLIKTAHLVMTPPGLHTIYECASLETPVVFLPEQNSQYLNAERLYDYGYPECGALFHCIEPIDDEGDPDGVYVLYDKIIPKYLQEPEHLIQKLSIECEKMLCHRYRADTVRKQREAVLRMVNSFDGTAKMANDIRKDIGCTC